MDGAADTKAREGGGVCSDSDSGVFLLSVPTKEMEQDERDKAGGRKTPPGPGSQTYIHTS